MVAKDAARRCRATSWSSCSRSTASTASNAIHHSRRGPFDPRRVADAEHLERSMPDDLARRLMPYAQQPVYEFHAGEASRHSSLSMSESVCCAMWALSPISFHGTAIIRSAELSPKGDAGLAAQAPAVEGSSVTVPAFDHQHRGGASRRALSSS